VDRDQPGHLFTPLFTRPGVERSTFLSSWHRRRKPVALEGIFLRTTGPLQESSLQGSDPQSRDRSSLCGACAAADAKAGSSCFQWPAPCGHGFCELRADRREAQPAGYVRARTAVPLYRAAVMWNSISSSIGAPIFGLQTNGRTESIPDVAAASGALEYGYTPGARQPRGLASRSDSPAPGLVCRTEFHEGSACQPHQAVG